VEWTQLIIFFLGVFGLFVWNRTDNRNDYRHAENRNDILRNLIDEMRKENFAFKEKWLEETKDFHNRLCDIERKRKH